MSAGSMVMESCTSNSGTTRRTVSAQPPGGFSSLRRVSSGPISALTRRRMSIRFFSANEATGSTPTELAEMAMTRSTSRWWTRISMGRISRAPPST